MFRERARTFEGLAQSLDALCIVLAFGAAFLLRIFHESLPLLREIPSIPWLAEQTPRAEYALLLLVNLLVWLAVVRRSGVYAGGDGQDTARVIAVYTRAWLGCLLGTGTLVFAFKMASISRLFFAYYFVLVLPMQVGKHVLLRSRLRKLQRGDAGQRHALVIGPARAAAWFGEVVRRADHAGHRLIGLVRSDADGPPAPDAPPVLGTLDELDDLLAGRRIDEVFLVGSAREMAGLAPVAQDLIERGKVVSLVATPTSGSGGVLGRITEFNGVPVIAFGPMPRDEVRTGVKRLLDVGVSGVALLLLSPLLLTIAAAIRIRDPGPVFFVQERLGRGGGRFRLFKFRSMRVDAERALRADPALYRRYVEHDYKLPEHEDPRISRLGRFLRRTSLDELPQLWNVLRGDMTLVGPRPIVPEEIEKYSPYAELFLSVRPGLTGHWQVAGRSGIPYPERAFLDLDYVGRHSVRDDLRIILRTVPAVLKRRGAY